MNKWKIVKDDKSHWHYEKANEMLPLLGLYGPSRSGKDSVAEILVRDFGYVQHAQADAIRKILLGLDPLLRDNNDAVWSLKALHNKCGGDWNLIKEESRESTDFMIRLGQNCRDVLGIDVWLNTALPPVGSDAKVVISDVRQPNEYEAIKARGGEVWKITRPSVTEYRGMDGLLESYDFDARIDNRGTLADLRGVVQATIATSLSSKTTNISHRTPC